MTNKKLKSGSAPASSTQTGKKCRKITTDREVEIELEDELILMMTTEDIFEILRAKGCTIEFFSGGEDEFPYIVEELKDWFNLPKDFQDSCFEVCVNHAGEKFVLYAYKE